MERTKQGRKSAHGQKENGDLKYGVRSLFGVDTYFIRHQPTIGLLDIPEAWRICYPWFPHIRLERGEDGGE